jgi:hypothetical protein
VATGEEEAAASPKFTSALQQLGMAQTCSTKWTHKTADWLCSKLKHPFWVVHDFEPFSTRFK